MKTLKNHPKKLHTYGSWEFFFSAAPTAQNRLGLHFHFINSFIQPSRVGSLDYTWRLKTSKKTKMLYVLLLQNLEGKLYSSVYKNLGHITTLMST